MKNKKTDVNFDLEDLHNKVSKIIKQKGAPVGIKFLKKKEMLKKLRIASLEDNRALCQILKQAAIYEKLRGVYFENIDACVVGSFILGFGMPPKDIKKRWVEGWAYTDELFDKLVKNIETMPQGEYEAAIFGPLKDFNKFNLVPDVVILITNSVQVYLLLVGLFDATGKKTVSAFNGHAACEIIASVAQGKSPWLTIPCGGARSIADSQDDEIWFGMTVDELNTSLERLSSIGFKNPPAVSQMIVSGLNPKHPLTGLIARNSVSKKR